MPHQRLTYRVALQDLMSAPWNASGTHKLPPKLLLLTSLVGQEELAVALDEWGEAEGFQPDLVRSYQNLLLLTSPETAGGAGGAPIVAQEKWGKAVVASSEFSWEPYKIMRVSCEISLKATAASFASSGECGTTIPLELQLLQFASWLAVLA